MNLLGKVTEKGRDIERYQNIVIVYYCRAGTTILSPKLYQDDDKIEQDFEWTDMNL